MSKQPTMKKTISVMTTAALAAGVVAPIVAPMNASANSDNLVDKVLHVDNDYKTEGNAVNTITIKEKDIDFSSGDTFRLTLPAGVKWLADDYKGKFINSDGTIVDGTDEQPKLANHFEVVSVTDQDLELKIQGFAGKLADVGGVKESVKVPMRFEVDGAEGELKVSVDAKGSTLTSGQYTFAVVAAGKTSTTVSEVKAIGDGGAIGTIRIDELAIGSMETGKVTLTLPAKFKWIGTPAASFGVAKVDPDNNRKLVVTVDALPSTSKLNTMYISGLAIDADKDAAYGDVEVQVSGDGITDQDIVVAKYADYSTEISANGEVPTVLAGHYDAADMDDLETVEVTIKEKVAGTWITGRELNIELPSWVKVAGVDIKKQSGFDSTIAATDFKRDKNEIDFTVPAAKDNAKREMKVKFLVSTKADATGDITAVFSGKAGIEGEVVVAKAVAPVIAEFTKADVRTGIKNQAISNITLTEATKGALIKKGTVVLQLSDGVTFSQKPTVKVVEGNIDIDENSVQVDAGKLSFTIDSESTRASKIEISGLQLDLNRAVPQGDIEMEIGGTALVQNADMDGNVAANMFDRDYIAKKAIATVVTPAQGNATVGEVVFTVGKTTYNEAGAEKTMDVAPFIEASRTYLPVRYVAKSVGVEGSNIIWDDTTNTVTIMKDGRIAQLTIGSNVLTVNGAKLTMDTKAKIVDGRTVLPLRAVAQALGAQVDWNEANQTVTVK